VGPSLSTFCGSGQINAVTTAYSYDMWGTSPRSHIRMASRTATPMERCYRSLSPNRCFWITSGLLTILDMNDLVLECVAFPAAVRVLGSWGEGF
jgi:hypothetical protein